MDVAVRDPTPFPCSLRRYRVSLTLTQIVIAAGSVAQPVNAYPAKFGDPNTKTKYPNFQGNREQLAKAVDNIIIVGGTNQAGKLASFSETAPWITIHAPADNVWITNEDVNLEYILYSGTSFGK